MMAAWLTAALFRRLFGKPRPKLDIEWDHIKRDSEAPIFVMGCNICSLQNGRCFCRVHNRAGRETSAEQKFNQVLPVLCSRQPPPRLSCFSPIPISCCSLLLSLVSVFFCVYGCIKFLFFILMVSIEMRKMISELLLLACLDLSLNSSTFALFA